MNNLNSILIEGNLVRDPLLRSTTKGTQVCSMRLASNRYFKHDSKSDNIEKEVSFFDVESWSRLAEACYSKGHKGRGVRVVGRLKEDRWNSPDGKSHSRVSIVAEHVEFRPEFKKESQSDYSKSSDLAGEYSDQEMIAAESKPPYINDLDLKIAASASEKDAVMVLC